MSGLSRFDFYPRDWHLDTRDLGNAAKGVYIDLLASMYARGGPLPANDEREMCRICGCATARSLRPLLAELINKGKLKLIDGHLTNGRAMEEIAKAERRQAIASSGGAAKADAQAGGDRAELDQAPISPSAHVSRQRRYRDCQRAERHQASPEASLRAEFGSNSTRTRPEVTPDIEENQGDNLCSPSPSPSQVKYTPTECAVSARPVDLKKPLYDAGEKILGPRSGSLVTNLLKHSNGDCQRALDLLRLCEGKGLSTTRAREYVNGILRGDTGARADDVVAQTDRLYREIGVR
jgi:uncharacterized protein YdaU (DUF1376 family)